MKIMVWLALAACGCTGRPPTKDPDVPRKQPVETAPMHFSWCGANDPDTIDPGQLGSSRIVLDALFDGLTTAAPDGLAASSIATRWTHDADATTWTFHLRTDARWSDGAAITARSFVDSAARNLWPTTESTNQNELWMLRNGRAFADRTVKVVLRDIAPFRAGEIVHIDATDPPPDSNLWRATAPVRLKLAPREDGAALGAVSPGTLLHVLDATAARDWILVYAAAFAGQPPTRGWLRATATDQPLGDTPFQVRSEDGREGIVPGRDLLTLPPVLGIEALDERTLRYTLNKPTPGFAELTLGPAMRPVPIEAWLRHGEQWTQREHVVTSGPFHLTDWLPGDRFELEKSATFWGHAQIRLHGVTIHSVRTPEESLARFQRGECDATVSNNVPQDYLAATRANPPPELETHPFLGVYALILNSERVTNPHVRRALALGLDRQAVTAAAGNGTPAAAWLSPTVPLARLPAASQQACLARDPRASSGLMRTDGCYVPPAGLAFDASAAQREWELARQELGEQLPTRISYTYNRGEAHARIAAEIAQQWNERFGIDVELREIPWPLFLAVTRDGDFEVARMGWILNNAWIEHDLMPTFLCGAPDNRTRWCSAQLDQGLMQAQAARDPARRAALLRQAESTLLDGAAVIPLYHYQTVRLRHPKVRGLAMNVVDLPNLRHVSIGG